MNGLVGGIDDRLETIIRKMPKVELHVHLEGSIQPETLLSLASRNHVDLPASTIDELRRWYVFTDFPHFAEVYQAISRCIRTADDIEAIACDFLAGQSAQNIRYTEVTYTALTHYRNTGLTFADQLAAINRARRWASETLHISMKLIIDIPRDLCTAEEAMMVAEWAVSGKNDGVVALGLGGYEVGHPPEQFAAAFARAREAGLPGIPHAGETTGPEGIWGALDKLEAVRIGHGVRCLEDPRLVKELRTRTIPLEVCPTSNVCLKVARDLASHPFPALLREGLYITVNSDDPPIFNTTLTQEFENLAATFRLGIAGVEQLTLNAVRASILPEVERRQLEHAFVEEFKALRG